MFVGYLDNRICGRISEYEKISGYPDIRTFYGKLLTQMTNRNKNNKLFNLLEYADLLDEVVDEEWEGDTVDRYLTRNRKDLFQMDDDIEFKLGSGL
uniref:Uncharacterized protein n=1 Tax=Romanomermis culicivorax TaxID=13658 RepID=A0A915JQS6_ROMCU